MLSLETVIGFLAAVCTTVSYFPQLIKAFKTGSTGDLSFKMLATLGAGLALWVTYGLVKGDFVIVLANAVSLTMVVVLGFFKLREGVRT
jgi:MtN3 and saliva related transmembrane protein